MKKIISILGIMLCSSYAFSQSLQIKGNIIDEETQQPIETANVVLWTADSIFVSGCISNQKGTFLLEKVSPDSYYLIISYLGYEPAKIMLPELHQDVNVGNVSLLQSGINIGDVEITASAIVNTRDRFIAFPTEQQIKTSKNGIELLQSLSLPRLSVDLFSDKVTVSGGDEVQLRINGVKTTKEEVKSLLPSDIVRIEYFDNPGLRYGDAAAVLNYITRRHTTGSVFNGNTMNSFVTMYGGGQANFRVNHKKSEFSVNYVALYRDYHHYWRKNEEDFFYPDNNFYNRFEKGLPGKLKFNQSILSGTYSYVDPDKHFFNAFISYSLYDAPKEKFLSELITTTQSVQDIFNMTDFTKEKLKIPKIDLYYQYSINKEQLILVNVVSTYTGSENTRLYQERSGNELISDYFSDIKGKRYSIIGEVVYENNFSFGKLSTGIKHLQSHTSNEYLGSIQSTSKLNQSETHIFAEFQGTIEKVNYMLGIRGGRSYVEQKGVEDYQTYSFLPTARLSYNLSDHASLKYSFWAEREQPSLSQLSDVEQIIDSLQIHRGNPFLKPNMAYTNLLTFDYRRNNIGIGLSTRYLYAHKPPMETTLLENGVFIRTYQMQKNFQRLNIDGSFSWKLFKNAIHLSVNGGMNRFFSNGNTYHHTYTNWYYNLNAQFLYKKWILSGNVYKERYRFWGETVNSGERIHFVSLKYNQDKYSIGIGVASPFANDFKTETQNFSELAPYKKELFVNDLTRMAYLSFSWNLSYGRNFKGNSKKIYNSDHDSSVLKGGK